MKWIKVILNCFMENKIYCDVCKCELGRRIFIGKKGTYCFGHMIDERIDEKLEEFKKGLPK